MESQFLGKALMAIGAVIAVAGAVLYVGGKTGLPGLGTLPGDIRVERPDLSFYFPIVTCIILSIILSVVALIISRLR